MSRKRKLSNLADRCRFCLARDVCMNDLFVDWLKPKLHDLEKCSSVEVLDKPNYPKSICYVCLYKIEMWSEFKLQFLKTNKTLSSHFKYAEPSENVADKLINSNDTGDLNSDNNQKRLKIDIQGAEPVETSKKLNETSIRSAPLAEPLLATQNEGSNENILSDTLRGSNKEDKGTASATKTQPSDSSITNSRKSGGRSRKIEREAFTKRWEERKNALIAATGEVPSESDSDNGAQLSPVQKARARSNNEKEQENQRRKIEKALKNLQTNMTEKYRINQDDIIIDVERKTRSRRTHVDDKQSKETKIESSKSTLNDMKLEHSIISTKENDKKKDAKETSKSPIKESEKKSFPNKELDQSVTNDVEAMELSTPVNETENQPENFENIEEHFEALDNNTGSADVDNDAMDVVSGVNKFNDSFTPQLVSSEVSIGNATYIVTTTLDFPDSFSSKSDISLKTNGLNIDATSQDGQKVDVLNAVELQRVQSKNTNDSVNKQNSDVQKCLKIEIEGMEVEALQRVQLELDHFVKEEIRKRVMDETLAKRKTDKKSIKFKDTYQTLDHQLKTIIEKILRTNYEAEKNCERNWSINNKKISVEFLKAAKKSPVFQPKVAISRLNISKLCKTYQINNLHILEKAKRQKGLVGPLSRTLGKRKHVLPKKYDGFSLSLKPEDDERSQTTTKSVSNKPSTPVPVAPSKIVETNSDTSMNISQFCVDYDIEDSTLSVNDKPSETNKTAQESAVEAAPTIGCSESAVEERRSPIVKETTNKPLPEIVDISSESPADLIENQVISTPLSAEKAIESSVFIKEKATKPSSLPVEKSTKSTSVNEQPLLTPSGVTELPVIKSKPLPVIYPKMKDIARPVITVMNSNKSVSSLPSIASRQTNTIVNSANKVPASPAKLPLPSLMNKNSMKNSTPVNNTHKPGKRQRHICGICGLELFSKEDAETHVKNHTVEPTPVAKSPPTANIAPTPLLQSTKPKPKLMRCKRCQAIVEARNVKTHVCDSVKYKCRLCDCSFGAEHLLVAHLETHTQIVTKPNTMKPPATSTVKKNAVKEPQRMVITKENYRKIPEHDQEEDLEEMLSEKEPQGYSCFVCDKVFVDEEQMKDHLQMHCEEISDESNEKGFQCAFCGEKFQTEESLETHVGDHLLEDGDEKINMLISMGSKRDKQKKSMFRCEQCSETFSSSLLLAMHLPMHEEEEAATMIAEYEKQQQQQDAEQDHHFCVVCDEVFDTAEELSEHQDVHNGNAHVCILCEKSFSSIKDLQEHVSTHL
ncbi:uncharacterized protein LOC100678424 isoform X2 [Nasonia vitripennis]|uniref:Uncharacterized protein n=1 Tax=Nasonia vitripennis TaxID=7425 RepID=A0A7M7H6E9_NASVI|nr:uncharacterized protein LOC100678424 isoform X2 [Nasonia vitripennis]